MAFLNAYLFSALTLVTAQYIRYAETIIAVRAIADPLFSPHVRPYSTVHVLKYFSTASLFPGQAYIIHEVDLTTSNQQS